MCSAVPVKLSHQRGRRRNYKLKILSTCLVLGFAVSLSTQTAKFRCAGPPLIETRPPSPSEVIRQLDAEKSKMIMSSESPEIAAGLRSAEKFHGFWLQDKKDALRRVGTIRHGLEDVLIANWVPQANERQIRNIDMWDGALYELMVYEVDPAVMASEASVRNFLLSVVKPPPENLRMSGPTNQQLKDGLASVSPRHLTLHHGMVGSCECPTTNSSPSTKRAFRLIKLKAARFLSSISASGPGMRHGRSQSIWATASHLWRRSSKRGRRNDCSGKSQGQSHRRSVGISTSWANTTTNSGWNAIRFS